MFLDCVKEQKTISELLSPEMVLKRQKLQNETLSLMSGNSGDVSVQGRIMSLFWSNVCYSTISSLRKWKRHLKRDSPSETEFRNFLGSVYSFFQTVAFNYSVRNRLLFQTARSTKVCIAL